MTTRKPYLDNIRSITVLLVVGYHVGYLYNGVGIPGGIPCADSLSIIDGLLGIVYPWFMVLLFAVSGICARYALEKRTDREFLRERTRKLLVPSTLGLFFIHWVTGYLNIKIGGGLEFVPAALVYPISVISGIGPLWFVQLLYLFSVALVLLRKLDKADKLWKFCGKAKLPVLMAMAAAIWAAAQIGNLPLLTMYRFGIYGAAFLIGYLVLSHESVQQTLQRHWLPLSAGAIACAVAFGLLHWGEDYTASETLRHWCTNLYAWSAVLAVLAGAGKWANRESPVTRWLAKNSFGIYVLHYPVLLSVCCLLHYHTGLPAVWKYALALPAGMAGTLLVNAAIRQVKLLRFAVLGSK